MVRAHMPRKVTLGPQQLMEQVMRTSVALADLNEVVDRLDQSPTGKRIITHPAWAPFIDALDVINDRLDELNGRASELCAEEFAASEREYDRAKQATDPIRKRR